MVTGEDSSSIEANGGRTRPLDPVAFVGEDGIGFGAVGDSDRLKGVCLCDYATKST